MENNRTLSTLPVVLEVTIRGEDLPAVAEGHSAHQQVNGRINREVSGQV